MSYSQKPSGAKSTASLPKPHSHKRKRSRISSSSSAADSDALGCSRCGRLAPGSKRCPAAANASRPSPDVTAPVLHIRPPSAKHRSAAHPEGTALQHSRIRESTSRNSNFAKKVFHVDQSRRSPSPNSSAPTSSGTTPKKPKPIPRISSSQKSQRIENDEIPSGGSSFHPSPSTSKMYPHSRGSLHHQPQAGPSRLTQQLAADFDDTDSDDDMFVMRGLKPTLTKNARRGFSSDDESSVISSDEDPVNYTSPQKLAKPPSYGIRPLESPSKQAVSPSKSTSKNEPKSPVSLSNIDKLLARSVPQQSQVRSDSVPSVSSNDSRQDLPQQSTSHIKNKLNGIDVQSVHQYTETEFTPPSATRPTFKVKWSKRPAGPHYISMLTSDADESRLPKISDPNVLSRQSEATVYTEVPRNSNTHIRWLRELGSELADFLNLDSVANKNTWVLEDFPKGYKLLEKISGPAGKKLRTIMLCGSWLADPFQEAKPELVMHFMTLINADEPCPCDNCEAHVREHGGEVTTSPPPANIPSSSRSSVLGEVMGPMRKLEHSLEPHEKGFTWSENHGYHTVDPKSWQPKDPVKSNAESAKMFKLKRRALAYGGPYVDPHQSEDVDRSLQTPSSWVRMQEVVWFALPEPIRSSENTEGDPIITHWPAIVCERKTVATSQLTGHVPRICEPLTSEAFQTQQSVEWHIRLLGCSDFVWATTEELLPFLAYKPFTKPLKAVVPNSQSYKRLWDDKEERPRWPSVFSFRDIENAYLSFAVALSHASMIMRKIILCDPFAYRIEDPVSGDATLSGGTHNESIRNWSSPHVAHYQGAFVGAERIWVGDLLRLRFTKSSEDDQILPAAGEKLDPRLFADYQGAVMPLPKPRAEAGRAITDRCLILLLNSIWTHPTSERVFVSGFVYEVTRAFDAANPSEPDVHPDFPPLPPPPYGWEFRLVQPLPTEYSFEFEMVAGRLYRSDIRARQHPDQSPKSEENKDGLGRAQALAGRKPGHELFTPFEEWEESRHKVIRTSETAALDQMKKWVSDRGLVRSS